MTDKADSIYAIILAAIFITTLILIAFEVLPVTAYYYFMTFFMGAMFYRSTVKE